MRNLDTTTAPEMFLAGYGPRWTTGLLSEHLDLFVQAGGEFRPGASRLGWAVVDRKAYPVVCSEIVRIDTEDGPMSGRCGAPAEADHGRCDSHAALVAAYTAASF